MNRHDYLDAIARIVETSLAEDVRTGDATTLATVPEDLRARGAVVAREVLVVSGIDAAEETFRRLDPSVKIQRSCSDGDQLQPGAPILEVEGLARALLTAERTALNILQQLSGVATLTRKFVEATKGTSVKILDTRKTTPGLRVLQKYAVACGGGTNHRFGLWDMVMIKDNHLVALRSDPNPIAAAVAKARQAFPSLKVEVEADTLDQVDRALEAKADIILLDNMDPSTLREAVRRIAGRAKTEASGGIKLENVREVAETGVDFISIGALTHSARAVDIALDFRA